MQHMRSVLAERAQDRIYSALICRHESQDHDPKAARQLSHTPRHRQQVGSLAQTAGPCRLYLRWVCPHAGRSLKA